MITSKQIYEYIRDRFNDNLTTLYEDVDDLGVSILTHKFDVKWMDKLSSVKELKIEGTIKMKLREYTPFKVASINDAEYSSKIPSPYPLTSIRKLITSIIYDSKKIT